MPDYIPGNDALFTDWMDRFNTYLNANYVRLGLSADDLQSVDLANLDWTSKYNDHVSAKLAAEGARDMKNNQRTTSETVVRKIVQRIQAWPGTTDDDRRELGITVRSVSPVPSDLPLWQSEDRPFATVDGSTRRKHVLRIGNQTNTGTTKGKPAGALGCEVFLKVGDLPIGPEEMQCVGVATRSPFVVEFGADDGGKQAHYMMRWINSKGDRSSWSETVSHTIAA